MKKTRILHLLTIAVLTLAMLFAGVPFGAEGYAADGHVTRTPQTHNLTAEVTGLQTPTFGEAFPAPTVTAYDQDRHATVPIYSTRWQKETRPGSDDWEDVTADNFPVALEGNYRFLILFDLDTSLTYSVNCTYGGTSHTHDFAVYDLLDDEGSSPDGQGGFNIEVNGEVWERYTDFQYDAPEAQRRHIGAVSPSMTVTAGDSAPLVFLDSAAFDIEQTYPGEAIMPFSVADRVGGGTPPYTFSKTSGPSWIQVSEEGEVSGTPESEGVNTGLVVTVTDSAGESASITIDIGATAREVIGEVRAYSLCAEAEAFTTIEEPFFTVIKGFPAEFYTAEGGWEKYVSGAWTAVPDGDGSVFSGGDWRYHCVVKISGMSARLSVLKNTVKAYVDDTQWTVSDFQTYGEEGDYVSQVTVTSPTMTVESIPIDSDSIFIQIPTSYYTGEPVEPLPSVQYHYGTEEDPMTLVLEKDRDYTLTYSNNTAVGTASFTMTGLGALTGTTTRSFSIRKPDLSSATTNVVCDIEDLVYTGEALYPEPEISVTVSGVQRTLIPGTDYTVTYENNVEAGEATFTVTGQGNYTGSYSGVFIISPKEAEPVMTLSDSTFTYNGSAQTPTVTVKDGETTLAEGTDYTLKITDKSGAVVTSPKSAGTYTVTATLKGNYSGTASATYTIEQKKITPAVTLSASAYTYDGSSHTPAVTVKDGEKTLVKGTDYMVKITDKNGASVTSPKAAGTYTVTVTLKGGYSGTATAAFTIAPKKITPTVTLSAKSYIYNGKIRKPMVTVKNGTAKMTAGTDYKVTYASGRKNVGKYSVKVTLTGNYSGSKTVYFKIRPKATTLVSVTGYRNKCLVKWNRQSAKMATERISGYQIQTATNSSFTKNKKTVTRSGYRYTKRYVKNLKGGKKYYVRIRTYKTINGVKYYSKWSKAKTVTVKK